VIAVAPPCKAFGTLSPAVVDGQPAVLYFDYGMPWQDPLGAYLPSCQLFRHSGRSCSIQKDIISLEGTQRYRQARLARYDRVGATDGRFGRAG
jgi:hypothetical protein